jgi:peptidoglycan/LPS O-acetylase OafA/YrhL
MSSADPAPSAPVLSHGRLPGLDMLRGIAALCVLGLHLHSVHRGLPNVFGKGYLAVDLFFMLSGYVMARTYDPRLERGLTPVAFLFTRYWRLWPIMAIGSLIGLPKLFLERPDLTGFFATAGFNFMLLPIPSDGPGFPLNIPAWSIFFELTANFVHGLVLWRLGARWIAALILLAIPLTAWVGASFGSLDVGAHAADYLAGLPRVMLSYLIGIALWRWWRDRPPLAVPAWLAFAAMPLILTSAWLFDIDTWQLDLAFIAIGCPLLIAGGLRFAAAPDGRLAAAAVALGALSFPLYAVHMPTLDGMKLLGFGPLGGVLAALAAGIALTVGVEARGHSRKQRKRASA